MSEGIHDEHSEHQSMIATGEVLATRVFTIAMLGIFVAILMMIILSDY